MTQTLTTELLNDMADGNWPDSGFYDTIKQMARELMANREAQPVAYLKKSIIDSERFDSADPEIILHPNTPEGWLSEYQAVFTAPPAPAVQSVVDWRLDESTGAKILMYKDCSVIEDQQAEYVLSLIQAAAPEGGNG